MKKFVTSLLAMVMLLSLCTGCGGQKDSSSTGDTASAGTPSAETVVLRLANSHNAEHITSQACQMFADLVNEKTDGRITIECHFAGELGDERSTIEQCQFGGLDFTRVSSGASAEFAPLMNALQMPYEYTSVDHLFEVLDGEIGQEVFETFKDNNLVGITYLHPGSRNFFNSKKEIHTPADLAGMKIRVSFWELAPYWTYDGHSYMPDMILASKQTMDKLSAEDQQIIFDCAKEAEVWHREAWEESEAKNAKIAEEKGCTLTTLTDEEVKLFQDAVAPMYDTFLNADQKAIVERVQALG